MLPLEIGAVMVRAGKLLCKPPVEAEILKLLHDLFVLIPGQTAAQRGVISHCRRRTVLLGTQDMQCAQLLSQAAPGLDALRTMTFTFARPRLEQTKMQLSEYLNGGDPMRFEQRTAQRRV